MQWLIQTIFLNLSCKIWQVYLSATLEIYITNTWNLNMISFRQISSIFANFALSWKSAFCQMLNAENYTGVEWQGLHQFKNQRKRKMLLWNLDLHHWSFFSSLPFEWSSGKSGCRECREFRRRMTNSPSVRFNFPKVFLDSLFPNNEPSYYKVTYTFQILIRSFCIFGSDCMHFLPC